MKISRWMQYIDARGQITKNQVKHLGVILETHLSFSSHVKAVTKSVYYHLKNVARIKSFVSSQDFENLVHAFITSRVDYCNGLLTGLPKKTIRQLQLIQNAAARILTRTRKYEHIIPVLRSLHWLPVTLRTDFKVRLLVYKSLNGLGSVSSIPWDLLLAPHTLTEFTGTSVTDWRATSVSKNACKSG